MDNCSEVGVDDKIHTDSKSLNSVWIFQIVWGQLSFILGITGNVFVLYATVAHNAIKLDKMSVWIINNLAVADIFNCILVLLPILLTQYGKLNDTLLFGETFYITLGCYMFTFYVANIFLVNFLAVNKFLRCLFPLRNLDSSRRQRIAVTIVTIMACSAPIVLQIYNLSQGILTLSDNAMYADYFGVVWSNTISIKCKMGQAEQIIDYLIMVTIIVLPCVSLIIFNFALVILAVKNSNTSINKQNLLISILMIFTFLSSYLPYLLVYLLKSKSLEAEEIAVVIPNLTVWNNPLIYFAVNRTFKTFVQERIIFWN